MTSVFRDGRWDLSSSDNILLSSTFLFHTYWVRFIASWGRERIYVSDFRVTFIEKGFVLMIKSLFLKPI